MRSLLGESGSQDRLLRKLFLDRLPTGVRRIIVSHPVEDLDQLAKIADRVMEENRKCTSGFGDGPEYDDYASSVGTSNVSLSTLRETVTDLAQTVTSLTHSLQSMPHTQHHFPNTRDNNATTTSFPQRSPIKRDTLPPRSSTSVRLRSFSPSPSSSRHSRSWSPRRWPVWNDRLLQLSTPAPSLILRPQRLNPQSSICYIHRKYGDQARYCAGNCNWRVINRNAFRNPNSPHINIITGETHPWFVRDPNTNIAFIIDTGSRDSIIPCQRSADDPRTSGYLSAANGSQIVTYERVTLRVTLGLPAEFSWDFLNAASSHAIIGLDFLEHFQISLNPHRRLMTLPETHEKTSTLSTTSAKLTDNEAIAELHRPIPTAQTVSSLEKLFSQYPSVFKVDNFHTPTRHQTLHHIRTVGPPDCSKVRRLSPEKLDILKSELQKLLDLRVIEPTESPYASPVHLVPKKNPGEFRITGDFRLLNEQTIADKYSLSLLLWTSTSHIIRFELLPKTLTRPLWSLLLEITLSNV